MKHSDFHIGLEFFGTAGFRWRCTDVGTRTILAIQLEHDNPDWYQGPPYIAKETVFDESDIERCHLTLDEGIAAALREHESSGHPGYPAEVVSRMMEARLTHHYPHEGVLRFDRRHADEKSSIRTLDTDRRTRGSSSCTFHSRTASTPWLRTTSSPCREPPQPTSGSAPPKQDQRSPTRRTHPLQARSRHSLLSRAEQPSSSNSLVSFDALRRARCPRTAIVRMFQAILNGSMICYRQASSSRLDELLVNRADVARVVSACRPSQPTIMQFQERYSLNSSEVCALAAHLAGANNPIRTAIPKLLIASEFDRFTSRFRGVAAYARAKEIRYKAALTQLRLERAEILDFPVPSRHFCAHFFCQ